MASTSSCSLHQLMLMVMIFGFFHCLSMADVQPTTPVAPSTACNVTMDPSFCKSVLPPGKKDNLYGYGRFSLAKSLSNAEKFLGLVNKYLARSATLSMQAVRALEDCQLLSGLNIDFLTSAGMTLNSTTTLVDPQTEKLQTLLSALITNQQTCMDGIQAAASAWSLRNGLAVPLSNGTKLYSVSLALFTRAWVSGMRRKGESHGQSRPAKLPKKPRHGHGGRKLLFNEVGRRLLQQPDQVQVTGVAVVSQDGSGNFTTISDAVASAPNNTKSSDGYYLIYVQAGVYQEYVSIAKNKKYIMMMGDGINQTVVAGSHSVVDGWTTFNSATFAVVGEGFVAVNMTFRNEAGPGKHQAVAVRNGADLSTFYSCSFEGYQDTLYTHSMRQFYKGCDVYGTVDYIFGNAAAVFQGCNIYSRLPLAVQSNTVTAQGRTDPNQNTGISIQGCSFLSADDLAGGDGSTRTYLGRPWKNYSRTVIMDSFMGGLVDPAGWLPWDGDMALSTLYYAEYNNTGPGSGTASRVAWPGLHVMVSGTDASNFTVASFIMGDVWLPPTGVPFTTGML